MQTVPMAEYYILWVVLSFSVPPVHIYTDHANVLRHVARGRAWSCAADRPYAGLWRLIWDFIDDLGLGVGVSFHKVKAHMPERLALETGQWQLWRGNGFADGLAKRGRDALPDEHVAALSAATAAVDASQVRALASMRWAAEIHDAMHRLGVRDSTAEKQLHHGRPRQPRIAMGCRARSVAHGGHDLALTSAGDWVCLVCRRSSASSRFVAQWCSVPFASRIAAADSALPPPCSHRLWVTGELYWCAKCGCHSQKRLRGLAGACHGHVPALPTRLLRLRRDLHPSTNAPLGGTKRPVRPDELEQAFRDAAAAAARQAARQRTGHEPRPLLAPPLPIDELLGLVGLPPAGAAPPVAAASAPDAGAERRPPHGRHGFVLLRPGEAPPIAEVATRRARFRF